MLEAVDFAPSRSVVSARGLRTGAVGAGRAVDAAWTRRFPMRRLMVVLAFAGVLAAPARASAMTDSQASKAVARKLASVYGSVWRTHTPSWSKPECRQFHRPQGGLHHPRRTRRRHQPLQLRTQDRP